jgi:sensor domain DACNV-containing protein
MSFRFIYPRDLAPTLVAKLERAEVPEGFRKLSPTPTVAQAELLLDVAYAASLQEDEGRATEVSLAWVDRSERVDGPAGLLPLRDALPLTPEAIRRLASAVEPKRGYLLVGPTATGGADIWGLLHLHFSEEVRGSVPALVVQIVRPGTLRIRHIVDDYYLLAHGTCVELLGSDQTWRLLRLMTLALNPAHAGEDASPQALTLLRIALNMLRQKHGGAILVALDERTSAGLELRFCVESPRTQLLRQAVNETLTADIEATSLTGEHAWEATLNRRRQAGERLFAVEEFIGQLTAVDGALLLRADLELVSFGVIIGPLGPDVGEIAVRVVNPVDETQAVVTPLSRLDLGTRHQSVVRFCFMNPGALALVASQDGTLSFCTRAGTSAEVLLLRPYSMDVGALR